MKKVHSEIMYHTDSHPEYGSINIHSDICPPNCNFEDITDDYRQFLHDNLDEWLDKSNGTGIFYIREEGYRDYGNEG